MGAAVSTAITKCEEPSNPKMTSEEMQLQKIHEMPKYARVESFEQKLYRKVNILTLASFRIALFVQYMKHIKCCTSRHFSRSSIFTDIAVFGRTARAHR